MKRKIVGILIILFGVFILAGMIYAIVFMEGFSFSDIMDIFNSMKKTEITETVENEKPDLPLVNNDENVNDVTSLKINPNRTLSINDKNNEEERSDVEVTNEPAQNNREANKSVVNKESIARMASSFAERFGSFSNQSDYKNISDLKPYMTVKMKKWADSYIAENRANGVSNIYYGIITKSVTYEYLSYDDDMGSAEIVVKARRRESVGISSNTTNVFYQDIKISLIKENGAWKIDSAYWQEK